MSKQDPFMVPPECGGQIVIVAYACMPSAYGDGFVVIQRSVDQSDGEVSFYIADADEDEEGDFQNGAPSYDFAEMTTKEQRDYRLHNRRKSGDETYQSRNNRRTSVKEMLAMIDERNDDPVYQGSNQEGNELYKFRDGVEVVILDGDDLIKEGEEGFSEARRGMLKDV